MVAEAKMNKFMLIGVFIVITMTFAFTGIGLGYAIGFYTTINTTLSVAAGSAISSATGGLLGYCIVQKIQQYKEKIDKLEKEVEQLKNK